MPAIRFAVLFCLSFVCLAARAQQDADNGKAAGLAKKNLVYYWPSRHCPAFKDTQKLYGFRIVCKDSRVTARIKRHNARVIRKINAVYGGKWFEEHMTEFY